MCMHLHVYARMCTHMPLRHSLNIMMVVMVMVLKDKSEHHSMMGCEGLRPPSHYSDTAV